MKNILSFYANLLLKLSLTQSILITTFTWWIQCLWGGIPCQHIPPKCFWKFCITRCSMLGEIAATSSLIFCFKSAVISFRTPCSLDILRARSIATRDTRSDEYWSADKISSESRQNRCFLNTSPQQKPDALQTSAPWQMKWFESR